MVVGMELWQTVAAAVGCVRVAKNSAAVTPNDFRSPNVSLLLGSAAWVEHTDNGIRFPLLFYKYRYFVVSDH